MGINVLNTKERNMASKSKKSTKTVEQPSLADALFPKVRQRVLGVLLGAPGRSFYTTEVIGLAQSGSGAVQRELTALADAGVLTVTRHGAQKHYQANEDSPVFMELHWLVVKTMDVGAQPS
jgi:hypothetical protein